MCGRVNRFESQSQHPMLRLHLFIHMFTHSFIHSLPQQFIHLLFIHSFFQTTVILCNKAGLYSSRVSRLLFQTPFCEFLRWIWIHWCILPPHVTLFTWTGTACCLRHQITELSFRNLGGTVHDCTQQSSYFSVKEAGVQWLAELVN